ncbi:LOW QUALITY PROTEIN: hepatocyte growth factor-like protein [Alosa alosa]|uniref:hepatocyte growth factor-like protein n=1 Tax=Alosa sapidissima TaxID=34773 RepID=UPI001C08368F|nr:hepatocyte growth factor-like protein [Alosa sapidissima]XP_048110011.1 LOW QUALITY PROTEIN: hepatocyte growth factor-like protein [Alosa alosa]
MNATFLSTFFVFWSFLAVDGSRSALNDYQRSEGRELVAKPWNVDRVRLIPGLTLEQCAQRCTEGTDCRAFNYETRPTIACKQLPWVGDGDNAEVKRNVNCDLYEKKVYVRKCIVGKGEDYRGKVSVTKNGHKCQQWWSKFPHDHRWTPTATNGLELNYCRNPDGDPIGPWCYTTHQEHRYESCNIPHCKNEVCITCNGEDYRGQVDHTKTGRECQRWDQQHPHQHIYQPEKYPEKSLDDNYCRNPDASPVPWCYTTDPLVEREDCEIRKCEPPEVPKRRLRSSYTTNCFRGRGEDYRGKVNETTSGIPCQRWEAQRPHIHPFYPHIYECKGLEENYCRNPDGSEAPWCFTSVSEMRTALCLQIKRCADDIEAEDCYHDSGKNYRGTVHKTRKGINCQKWSGHTPHKTKINPKTNPDANLTENYCRNPDGDLHGPWCYTTDPKTEFDYCAIKRCDGVVTEPSIRPPEKVEFSECGKRENRPSPKLRIVGGLPGNSPWTVSLRDRKGNHFCGGSLVNSKWVISTKQCFSSCYVDLTGYSAVMGTLFRDPKAGEPDRQVISLTKIVCGPSESHLVMLQLEKPAQFNERVSQICLPPERYIVAEDTTCEIAGWGETKGTGDESVLNVAQMAVLSNKECNKYFRGRVKENEMCTTAFHGPVGACERDYGGPLACEYSDCWVLEGVIIPMRRCGHPGQPNIFIRVSAYVDWIKKVMVMA